MPLYPPAILPGGGTAVSWLDVKNYGAKGDGTTDDTTAIQAALTAANVGTAATVYIPQGNYIISNTLTVGNFTMVIGDGVGYPSKGTQISMSDATGNKTMFSVTNGSVPVQDVVFKDMTLYSGNAVAIGTGNGIFMQSTGGGNTLNQVIIEHIKVVNFGGSGIKLYSPIFSKLDTVYALSNGATTSNHGIEVISASSASWTSVNFLNCYANTNAGYGYKLDTATYVTMSACAADHNVVGGYFINNCQGIALVGCGSEYNSAETTTANMLRIDGASVGVVVDGFFGYYNGHYAIYVTGNSSAILNGCVENTPSAGAVNSFKSDSGSYVNLNMPSNVTAYSLGGNYHIFDKNGQIALVGSGGTALSTTDVYGVFTTHAASTIGGLATLNAGTNTAGSAPVLTPTFANGTAAQLSDLTRDYMVYLEIGTAGTAFVVAIGPTSTPANTIVASGTATTGESVSFRLPAGWYVKWSATTATLANQKAIGC